MCYRNASCFQRRNPRGSPRNQIDKCLPAHEVWESMSFCHLTDRFGNLPTDPPFLEPVLRRFPLSKDTSDRLLEDVPLYIGLRDALFLQRLQHGRLNQVVQGVSARPPTLE